ncbi:barstar family protein [Streptomyces sp. NBC_00481]|uniref:barstar family protein n=1 Tax=Streptomyces sp. NBC_00481 TaxID=2975755 RepID=UPI002DDC00AF|nr:barstar family protein [Streptomyces sp. NBC_00481]WRY96445.1 barstar family protein [Streptomyces sp. NBC_00481]
MTVPAKIPLYRIVEKGVGSVLISAEEIHGFFLDEDDTEQREICLTGVKEGALTRQRIERGELEVVNFRQQRIGMYDLGRVRLHPVSDPEDVQRSYSFLGYTCEYPKAGDIWRRWAAVEPLQYGEWARLPVGDRSSWLHVAQNSWFSALREPVRYGESAIVAINGRFIADKCSLFCALGEAVNGPGGYFGSNLDALADSLSKTRQASPISRVVWSELSTAREMAGGEFVDSVIGLFREFGVEVDSFETR